MIHVKVPDSLARLGTHPVAAVLLVAAVIASVVLARYFYLGTSLQTYDVTQGELVQSVVASGRIMSPRRVSIAAEVTGRVTRVLVEEGESVRRGQLLIVLDQSDERAAVAQAEAALTQAEAKIRQLQRLALPAAEQALLQAQANLRQAEQGYQRTHALVAKGFVSQAQLDDAQHGVDVAQTQVRTAQLQLDSQREGGSDYEVAQAARREAEMAIRVAQAKLDATEISAPADGTLIARSVEPGDVTEAGKQLLLLATAGETQLIANIDEKNLAKLNIGQEAVVSADAFPDQRFEAELFYVNPGVDPVRGAVEVKLRVPKPPAYLRQDMTVSIDIEVGRRSGVVIVSADAIHDLETDQPWVLVVRDGRAVKQTVKLGMVGDGAVQVLGGVAPGDRLVPASNGVVLAGQHVRTVVAGNR